MILAAGLPMGFHKVGGAEPDASGADSSDSQTYSNLDNDNSIDSDRDSDEDNDLPNLDSQEASENSVSDFQDGLLTQPGAADTESASDS